jgi:hypothetical protein
MCFRMVDGCSSSCSVDLICRSSSSIRSLLLSLLLFVTICGLSSLQYDFGTDFESKRR